MRTEAVSLLPRCGGIAGGVHPIITARQYSGAVGWRSTMTRDKTGDGEPNDSQAVVETRGGVALFEQYSAYVGADARPEPTKLLETLAECLVGSATESEFALALCHHLLRLPELIDKVAMVCARCKPDRFIDDLLDEYIPLKVASAQTAPTQITKTVSALCQTITHNRVRDEPIRRRLTAVLQEVLGRYTKNNNEFGHALNVKEAVALGLAQSSADGTEVFEVERSFWPAAMASMSRPFDNLPDGEVQLIRQGIRQALDVSGETDDHRPVLINIPPFANAALVTLFRHLLEMSSGRKVVFSAAPWRLVGEWLSAGRVDMAIHNDTLLPQFRNRLPGVPDVDSLMSTDPIIRYRGFDILATRAWLEEVGVSRDSVDSEDLPLEELAALIVDSNAQIAVEGGSDLEQASKKLTDIRRFRRSVHLQLAPDSDRAVRSFLDDNSDAELLLAGAIHTHYLEHMFPHRVNKVSTVNDTSTGRFWTIRSKHSQMTEFFEVAVRVKPIPS